MPLAACPSCGGTSFRPLPFQYRYEGATFPGGECTHCGLRGLTVQPAPAEFAAMYSRGYFEGGDVRCGHVGDYFAERPALLKDGARLAEWFASTRGGLPGRLLEVGCAAGATLETAAQSGWRVHGVEYSAEAAAEARTHGVPVSVGGLEDAHLPDQSYDVVFMGDVLEHVPDPGATLREVHRVLAPGGALVLRGPMATHSIARSLGLAFLKGEPLTLAEPPYHLWEFEPKTLQALARNADLVVTEFQQSKTPPSLLKRKGAQALTVAALDAANAAWTALTGALGDRCTMVARRPRLEGGRA